MIESHKEKVEAWLNHIQKGEGALIDWFLFTGVIAFVTYFWMQIIKRMVD